MTLAIAPGQNETDTLVTIRTAVYKLPRQDLFVGSSVTLVDSLLGLFDFNEQDAERGQVEKCAVVLKGFGVDIGGSSADIQELTGDKMIDHFLFRIIGFARLPAKEYEGIFNVVRKDLQILLELVDNYEQDPYIKSYLAGELRPEHEMKVRVDFYERCRSERDWIVKYITSGIYEVALYNSWLTNPEPVPEKLNRDVRIRPYYFRPGIREAYFDFRKINLFGHRLSSEFTEGQRKYLTEKFMAGEMDPFYEALSLARPWTKFFEDLLDFYTGYSPILGDRREIFVELKMLFVGQHWHGFAALALLQIEGIFSDIVTFIAARKKANSLAMKVNSVRPYYDDPALALDYYEYHLPRIRNRLAHLGHLPDYNMKTLAFDLLYDLWFLTELSTRLTDPSTKLNAACMANWTPELLGVTGVAKLLSYVEQVEALNHKGAFHKRVLEHWELYRKRTLCTSGMVTIAKDLRTTLSLDIMLAENAFNREAKHAGMPVEFGKMEIKDVQAQRDVLVETLSDMTRETKERFGEVYQTGRFLKIFNRHLPECDPEAKEKFENIRIKHKLFLGKVDLLKAAIGEFGFDNTLV